MRKFLFYSLLNFLGNLFWVLVIFGFFLLKYCFNFFILVEVVMVINFILKVLFGIIYNFFEILYVMFFLKFRENFVGMFNIFY